MDKPDFWKDGLRILCVRLDNMGDVLMTTPALRALKETWPTCELTLLTSSAGVAIAPFIPEVDQVIRFDVPWVGGHHDVTHALDPIVEKLRALSFDAAILFTVQSQNPLPAALLCYMADIRRVLGYCRENPYRLITDWIPDPEVLMATRHEVIRQLELVATVGCQTANQRLSLAVPFAGRELMRKRLTAEGLAVSQPWLVVHPGVSEAKRRYPADAFMQAISQIRREEFYQIVLTGSAAERPLTTHIAQQVTDATGSEGVLNWAGQLTIDQLIGLLAEAPLLLANNTGPVHIAAAVETPVVVLYAMTNPQHTPWQVSSRVLYFEVPPALRSRNVLLQQFPPTSPSIHSPADIVRAVRALLPDYTLLPND